jgi:hypothetical protein
MSLASVVRPSCQMYSGSSYDDSWKCRVLYDSIRFVIFSFHFNLSFVGPKNEIEKFGCLTCLKRNLISILSEGMT